MKFHPRNSLYKERNNAFSMTESLRIRKNFGRSESKELNDGLESSDSDYTFRSSVSIKLPGFESDPDKSCTINIE